jgi:hypothetical protein
MGGLSFRLPVLHRTPVIGFLLIVEMANAGDMRRMAVLLRPIDCFSLCFERSERVVGVIFNYIIVNMGTFGTALGARLNIDVRHTHISLPDVTMLQSPSD